MVIEIFIRTALEVMISPGTKTPSKDAAGA